MPANRLDKIWSYRMTRTYPAGKDHSRLCLLKFDTFVCTREQHTSGPHVAHNANGDAIALQWSKIKV